jgi:hypothetical protein
VGILRKKILNSTVEDKKVRVKKSVKNTALTGTQLATLPSKPSAVVSVSSESEKNSISTVVVPVLNTLILYKDVPSEKCFILCDGRSIHTCKELADILTTISDDIFSYHVTDTKNDFSNWINDIFEDHELAKKISFLKNRMEMSIEIYRHMFELLEKICRK